jgi:hypothetical protein
MVFWIFKYNPKVFRLEDLFDDPNEYAHAEKSPRG